MYPLYPNISLTNWVRATDSQNYFIWEGLFKVIWSNSLAKSMLRLLRCVKVLSNPGLAGKGVTFLRMEMPLPWATSSSAWPLLWNFLSQTGISCIANCGCCFFSYLTLRKNLFLFSLCPPIRKFKTAVTSAVHLFFWRFEQDSLHQPFLTCHVF